MPDTPEALAELPPLPEPDGGLDEYGTPIYLAPQIRAYAHAHARSCVRAALRQGAQPAGCSPQIQTALSDVEELVQMFGPRFALRRISDTLTAAGKLLATHPEAPKPPAAQPQASTQGAELVRISEYGEGQENECPVCGAEPGQSCTGDDPSDPTGMLGVEYGRLVHRARQDAPPAAQGRGHPMTTQHPQARLTWSYCTLRGNWGCWETGERGAPRVGDWFSDAGEWRIWKMSAHPPAAPQPPKAEGSV